MTGLDWRQLAPPAETHYCDCLHCDGVGAPEPIAWPVLVRMDFDGVDYVTDRYLMVRADLAPVPDGYEGTVMSSPAPSTARSFIAAEVTATPAEGLIFPAPVLLGVRLGGWRLRLLKPYTTDRPDLPVAAVVTTDGECVGWAISSRGSASDRFPEYREPTR